MRRHIALGAAVLIAGLGTFTLASPASAGSCGQVANVTVSGGQASWSHACSGGDIRVSGWVKDTDADGKCARVKAMYSNGTQLSPTACGEGTPAVYFDFNGPGSSVPVYLFTV